VIPGYEFFMGSSLRELLLRSGIIYRVFIKYLPVFERPYNDNP
jgi:hypothetical protein